MFYNAKIMTCYVIKIYFLQIFTAFSCHANVNLFQEAVRSEKNLQMSGFVPCENQILQQLNKSNGTGAKVLQIIVNNNLYYIVLFNCIK